ncbi:MAG: sirohydrochlorin chelatase [Micropruina sp.]|nr:sirohydrochlorin chelatase [Micropruina sp.]
MSRDLVLAVHGTRSPAGGLVTEELRATVAGRLPRVSVHTGWVDLHTPTLAQTLSELGEAVVVPVFLTEGFHVATDIPEAVAEAGGRASVTATLGDSLVAAVADRLLPFLEATDAVVLAAAGSKRQLSNDQVVATARTLAEIVDRPVSAGFLTAATPTVPDAVTAARSAGHRRVTIAPYLMAPGLFSARLAHCGADAVAEVIGVHPTVVDGIVRRYLSATMHPRLRRREQQISWVSSTTGHQERESRA